MEAQTIRNKQTGSSFWPCRHLRRCAIMLVAIALFNAFANAKDIPLCNASGSSAAGISLVGMPPSVVIRPISQDNLVTAIAHITVRNDGNTTLSNWCFSVRFYDYLDIPYEPKLSLDETEVPRDSPCRNINVEPGVIKDFALKLEVDPKRLPISGMAIIGASGLSLQNDTKAEEVKNPTDKQKKNNKQHMEIDESSPGTEGPKHQACTVNAKQVSQNVVLTLADSAWHACLIIGVNAFVGLICFLISVVGLSGKLSTPMGASQWSFSSSAATNLTIVGSLLGSVIASSALPDFPHYMTKQSYIVLSLFFAVLVALSPVLYNFFCKPVGQDPVNSQFLVFQGWVWLFFIADALTIWAVSGQLSTMSLLFTEFAARQHVSRVTAAITWIVTGVVDLSLLIYCIRTARYYVRQGPTREGLEEGVEKGLVQVTALPRRWTAL